MLIYGSTMSPFVRKVVAVANEKGLAFKLKAVGMGDPDPAYLAASPLRKMPAIDDDGFTLADSSAIIHYLEAKHPAPALIPAEARARGRTVWWDEFADTVLMAAAGKIFFNRIVAPRFMGRPGDEAAAAKAEAEEVPPLLAYLNRELAGREFLVGDALTLADLAVASPLVNLHHASTGVDGAAYPELARWLAAITARPSLADSIARETAALSG